MSLPKDLLTPNIKVGEKEPSHRFGSAGWLPLYGIAIDSMFGIIVEVSIPCS